MKLPSRAIVYGILVGFVVLAITAAAGWYIIASKPSSSSKTVIVAKKSTYQASVSNSVFSTKDNSKIGQYLVAANGHTLYVYNKDTSGRADCSGSCLQTWPAYTDPNPASSLPVNVGVIKGQDDGLSQFTYKSQPLYTYAADSNGSVNGNGVGGFTVVKP